MSRLIPACAGKTAAQMVQAIKSGGSSPRVRGKHSGGLDFVGRGRLIPACAGKTAKRESATGTGWAHPRVCGENRRRSHNAPPNRGSSPRVRGKPSPGYSAVTCNRLIPACAGKTEGGDSAVGDEGAHPRVCGENDIIGDMNPDAKGSSPRVRGKP